MGTPKNQIRGIKVQAPEGIRFLPAVKSIPVQLINDTSHSQTAELELLNVSMSGEVLGRSDIVDVELGPFGAGAFTIELEMPTVDQYLLFAELRPDDAGLATVWSRRKVGFANIGERGPDPPF